MPLVITMLDPTHALAELASLEMGLHAQVHCQAWNSNCEIVSAGPGTNAIRRTA